MNFTFDALPFQLNHPGDFSWLRRYGTAFAVFDQTGSGSLCFGMDDGRRKRFVKIAGADTCGAEISPAQSVQLLKDAVQVYKDISHPNLVNLLEHYPVGPYYVAVFDWAEGACLFDHWNFGRYADSHTPSPAQRFKALPTEQKLACAQVLFSFLETVARAGYVAVDFYDGSILYDFHTHQTTLFDIDCFRPKPAINHLGPGWFGTSRLKAPEEYRYNAVIGEDTNVFTLGALLFDFFGTYSQADIAERYQKSRFVPCPPEGFSLPSACYQAVLKAVQPNREERYPSISAFHRAWEKALRACRVIPVSPNAPAGF